uniref:Uncharacterized protein n=1 Tax=Candidatus Kentrum sp. SD TaxID=2126332 RepID=A0A450YFU4_9GAMM|nr:MAG: hypothetical protein BECKSD772F_GA0070984_100530 [Candidatus Kentron sp. SD]VFK40399.1 MAG: hypothetical protein BECKSD772E_GA0070983_100630 [Candidatus Kentron sp. SD]VFK78338.1 MAG: hypothetical protein BECKSD772D_GA0070982_101214 [Candidatus Kentron sp. SD]
MSHGVLPS